jgi:hypothetical protein
MSKTKRRNADNFWEEDRVPKGVVQSKKNKRFERALKTKDFSDFVEEDEDEENW